MNVGIVLIGLGLILCVAVCSVMAYVYGYWRGMNDYSDYIKKHSVMKEENNDNK